MLSRHCYGFSSLKSRDGQLEEMRPARVGHSRLDSVVSLLQEPDLFSLDEQVPAVEWLAEEGMACFRQAGERVIDAPCPAFLSVTSPASVSPATQSRHVCCTPASLLKFPGLCCFILHTPLATCGQECSSR